MEISKSAAYPTLKKITKIYASILPIYTYPWVMLSISSCCVFFSWFGGNYLFHTTPFLTRMLYQWLITSIEYSFLLPGISASVEVLGYSQNSIAILLQALQLFAYFILNRLTTNFIFTWKHYTAFCLMFISIFLVI